MNFSMWLLLVILCMAGGFALGMHFGFQMGFGDGYNAAVADLDNDNDIADTRWICCDYAAPAGVEETYDGKHVPRPLSEATVRRLHAAGFGLDADGKVIAPTPAGILTDETP